MTEIFHYGDFFAAQRNPLSVVDAVAAHPSEFTSLAPSMKNLTLISINLDLVTDSQRWDIHPFLSPDVPADLGQSIRETGILQPPILYEQNDGRYEILSGRRRILAAREICHLPECPCLVAPQTTPPPDLLSLLLESQRLSSELSPMEIACFFRIGLRYLSLADLAAAYLLKLTGKSSISILKKNQQLLNLEEETQQLVHNLFITEGMALDLLKLSPEDRIRLSRMFWDFQLGGGKQKRLFLLLRDICQRDSTSISSFLERPEITGLLQHREMNNPQKMQTLMSFLQQISTPSYQADENSFRSQVSQLKLPPYCGVQHSQAFETDEVVLTVRFEDIELLRKAWPMLHGVLQKTLN